MIISPKHIQPQGAHIGFYVLAFAELATVALTPLSIPAVIGIVESDPLC